MAWTKPKIRATFGISEAEALATKEMAFNQGFYNLFLAIVTVTGIVFLSLAILPSVQRSSSQARAPWWPPLWCCWRRVQTRRPPISSRVSFRS
ncbi:hypothetical protein HD598_000441 [Neomicrococcus aestuarii]|uniref:Uncharacterized protein n=1 Tax=Neomicrococcus aestuarii TaxID=556325 RepID=A0A7W8TS34_9MICC|nr:hypothetical protein [Neomicrococcus aestuarii]